MVWWLEILRGRREQRYKVWGQGHFKGRGSGDKRVGIGILHGHDGRKKQTEVLG